MLIPHIRPEQFKNEPDQVARLLNLMVDELNRLSLQNKK